MTPIVVGIYDIDHNAHMLLLITHVLLLTTHCS